MTKKLKKVVRYPRYLWLVEVTAVIVGCLAYLFLSVYIALAYYRNR